MTRRVSFNAHNLLRLSRGSWVLVLTTAVVTGVLFYFQHAHLQNSFHTQPSDQLWITPAEDGLGTADEELDRRLDLFLNRPVLDHENGRTLSHQNCPVGRYGREEFFHHQQVSHEWPATDGEHICMLRRRIVDRVAHLRRKGVRLVWDRSMAIPGRQRGVIYSGGYGAPLERVKLSLHMLKNVLRSELPVEFFYFEGEEVEGHEIQAEIRREYGRDITFQALKGKHDGQNFQVKHAAFLQTTFTEFIWIDSDNLPLLDPSEHFESVEYLESASVFWPDLYKDHPDNAVWRVLGMACSDQHWAVEAGQIVFDKRGNGGLNHAVLHIAQGMMEDGGWWDHQFGWGDKDTWRFAFYALGLPFQLSPKVFTAAGDYKHDKHGPRTGDFCGHANLHWGLTPRPTRSDPAQQPRPAFLHCNVAKPFRSLPASELIPYIRRPRYDESNDARLVETPSFYTGCLEYGFQGPDPTGQGEGQVLVDGAFEDAWRVEGKISARDWKIIWAVRNMTGKIVSINNSYED